MDRNSLIRKLNTIAQEYAGNHGTEITFTDSGLDSDYIFFKYTYRSMNGVYISLKIYTDDAISGFIGTERVLDLKIVGIASGNSAAIHALIKFILKKVEYINTPKINQIRQMKF